MIPEKWDLSRSSGTEQVEESVVGEEAVEARIRLLAAEPDVVAESMEQDGDGVAEATNGEAQMSLA